MAFKPPKIIQHTVTGSPHLVIAAAVHGNEKCGIEAIRRVRVLQRQGRIRFVTGTVTFISEANPLAVERNVRFIDRNLNRGLYPKDNPQCYEDHLGNALCPVFARACALLDLHSFTAPGDAFIFLGPPRKAEADFARALGVRNFVHGWQDSYKDALEAQGTTEYTRLFGGLAVTLECGSHQDPEAVEVAFQAILNALDYFGIAEIDPDLFAPRPVAYGTEQTVRMTDVFYKEEEGRFAQPWKNMSPVKKGDLLAVFSSGRQILAPDNGFVLMPVEHEKTGAEWFHFGVKSDFFKQLELSKP